MDQELILPFMKATKNLFETMFQMEATVGTPTLKGDGDPSYDVSGIISFSGDVEGSVHLSFPMATAQRLVSLFTGSDVGDDEEALCDAVGELVNMIAGSTKAQYEGKKVSLSCPSVIIGQGHAVHGARDVVSVCIPCDCDCGEFCIEIGIKGMASAGSSGATASAAKG